jgi:hypothetical protein
MQWTETTLIDFNFDFFFLNFLIDYYHELVTSATRKENT